jgi:hypothetical protein
VGGVEVTVLTSSATGTAIWYPHGRRCNREPLVDDRRPYRPLKSREVRPLTGRFLPRDGNGQRFVPYTQPSPPLDVRMSAAFRALTG